MINIDEMHLRNNLSQFYLAKTCFKRIASKYDFYSYIVLLFSPNVWRSLAAIQPFFLHFQRFRLKIKEDKILSM